MATQTPAEGVRGVNDEEVQFYREHGWVLLRGLLSPVVASELLDRIRSRMGEDASNEMRGDYRAAGKVSTALQRAWQNYDFPSQDDAWVHDLCFSDGLTQVTTRLMGDCDARYLADQILCKLSASRDGTKTPWHNDSSYFPFDRAGTLTIWIPLVDCPPEKGSLRFLSGSHRERPLGRYAHRSDVDIVADNPWLLDRYELSPPLHLMAGDATVHDHMTVHSAPENTTDEPRWVYTSHRFPAATLYTGTPQRFTDGLGLVINQPIEHENFPLLRASQ